MTKCLTCNEDTSNPKFCSRSCAAIYNNKLFPKKKRIRKLYKCIVCDVQMTNDRKYCDEHNPQKVDWSKVTIADTLYTNTYASNSYARIRDNAKCLYKRSDKPKKCLCGYDKHYEVCHIKAIKDFDKNTPISVVNSLNNLVALCPNCHWEFDHNILHLAEGGIEPINR